VDSTVRAYRRFERDQTLILLIVEMMIVIRDAKPQ
jgi:hypothetical protein